MTLACIASGCGLGRIRLHDHQPKGINMRLYETIYVARQDIPSGQVDAMSEQFSKIITGMDGKISKVEYCGLRQLAYKINKNRKGHYVEMHIEAGHEAILEMERQMRLHDDMLRFLTIRVEEFAKGPSPLSQTKGFRDSRRTERDDKKGFREGREGREPREGRETRENTDSKNNDEGVVA